MRDQTLLGRRVRRASLLGIVVLCLALPAVAVASLSAPKAVSACAGTRPLTKPLTAKSWKFLKRYVPCLVRQYRTQLGLKTTVPGSLSYEVSRKLRKMTNASSSTNRSQFVTTAGLSLGNSFCKHPFHWALFYGSTTRPRPTAKSIGSQMKKFMTVQPSATQSSHSFFGFGFRKAPVFHDGGSNNISYMAFGFHCNGTSTLGG